MSIAIVEVQYYDELFSIYGTEGAREIFAMIAERLKKVTRTEDSRFRVEADQMALIMPHTMEVGASRARERIKEALQELSMDEQSSLRKYSIEVKVGLYEYNEHIKTPMEFKRLAVTEIEYDV